MTFRRISPFHIGLMLCAIGCSDAADEFKPKRLAKPFPPIKDIKVIPGAEAKDMRDDEMVLGVIVGGEARAYPINMLTGPSREIMNDNLGGQAIAATW